MTAKDQEVIARQMQAVVTGTLLKEKRPGGLLAR